MMPGVTFEEIRNQIIDAYTFSELETVLRERMNLRIDRVVGPGNFDYVVFQLLGWAERMGREIELIRVTAGARQEHAGMRSVYQKYGMAVPVLLQQQGRLLVPATLPATDSGFEAQIKRYLSFLDVGLWREQLARLEGRVCRVEVGNGVMGTGFLVGPEAVLTNYHVLKAVLQGNSPWDKVQVRFDYKKLANGQDAAGLPVKLHPTDWRIDASEYSPAEDSPTPDAALPTPDQLDYALVRLERPLGREPLDPNPKPGATVPLRGWVQVPATDPAITLRMPILILQHPKTESLKLALDTEGVTQLNANSTRVRYATNTEPGSSGSPCFDLNWGLVALHHYGDPAEHHPPGWNQGVPIGMIRERLKRAGQASALGGDSP
jgi:hypothetical protein